MKARKFMMHFSKEMFTLKAILLWTITDYPTFGILVGSKVKGKQACKDWGKDTPHRWLKFSRKYVYMGNRKRLRPCHPFRKKKVWFDNTIESATTNRIQSGGQIFETLRNFRNNFGKPLDKKSKKKSKKKRIDIQKDEVTAHEEVDENSDLWRWKKRICQCITTLM